MAESVSISIDADIAQLDLDPVIFQLIRKEKWSLEKSERVVNQYRVFLHLVRNAPDPVVPMSVDVDIVWHHAILDTRKYQEDCDRLFGRYIHHFPYSGALGTGDIEAQRARYQITQTFAKSLAQKGEVQ